MSRRIASERLFHQTRASSSTPQHRLRNSAAIGPFTRMIAITITSAAYKALKMVRPETYDTRAGADGMIRIWLEGAFFNELARMKCPGEDYSEVILRLAKT